MSRAACFDVDEEYGGAGVSDFRYNVVVAEEMCRARVVGSAFSLLVVEGGWPALTR